MHIWCLFSLYTKAESWQKTIFVLYEIYKKKHVKGKFLWNGLYIESCRTTRTKPTLTHI